MVGLVVLRTGVGVALGVHGPVEVAGVTRQVVRHDDSYYGLYSDNPSLSSPLVRVTPRCPHHDAPDAPSLHVPSFGV